MLVDIDRLTCRDKCWRNIGDQNRWMNWYDCIFDSIDVMVFLRCYNGGVSDFCKEFRIFVKLQWQAGAFVEICNKQNLSIIFYMPAVDDKQWWLTGTEMIFYFIFVNSKQCVLDMSHRNGYGT